MELRLIIPASPTPGKYDIEAGYPSLSSPRYRSREIVSSVSNPEYRAAPYDRLEITIRERSVSSRKRSHQRTQGGGLVASKSTPNLRRPLENIPRPPPPPPVQYKLYSYRQDTDSDTSEASTIFSSPWSNHSSSGNNFSPVTPDNDPLFFRPSFQEQDTGLAIEFEHPEAQPLRSSLGSPNRPFPRPSGHKMVYELEDTSRSGIRSPIVQISPVSLLEKPLPLVPCSRSLEKKINASESYISPKRLKKQSPSTEPRPDQRNRSLNFKDAGFRPQKDSTPGYAPSKAYSYKSSAPSTHTTVSRTRGSRHTTESSEISFRHLQPDSPTFFQQRQKELKQSQRNKKDKKPFSIHIGRLHVVFGSTKQELADSRRDTGMYSGPYCQDSRGSIQHV